MYASFWIYQIGKRLPKPFSKTRITTHKLKNCMRPWIRSYQCFLDVCPPRGRKIVITRRSWELQTNFSSNYAPGGRKIVITRRSWQLQSSYFACADLWTCWIRCWYSRSPKLTKMICFWRFSFLYFFIFFIFFNFTTSNSLGGPPTRADLQLGFAQIGSWRTSNSGLMVHPWHHSCLCSFCMFRVIKAKTISFCICFITIFLCRSQM